MYLNHIYKLGNNVHAYNTGQAVFISSDILLYKRRQAQYTWFKIWNEILQSEIDVNSSQVKHNLNRFMLYMSGLLNDDHVTVYVWVYYPSLRN